MQLITLQGEVGLGGQEGPPRLLCSLRIEVELDAEVPVLTLDHLHHGVDPGLPRVLSSPGCRVTGLGLVTRWHCQSELTVETLNGMRLV